LRGIIYHIRLVSQYSNDTLQKATWLTQHTQWTNAT
jgi:hypothetical protein